MVLVMIAKKVKHILAHNVKAVVAHIVVDMEQSQNKKQKTKAKEIMKATELRANELRIGNLVNINEETRIDNTNELPLINPLFKIERIDEDGEIIIYSEINNLHIFCDLESIEPIPLTEEWLLKFGFERQENNWKTLDLHFATIGWEKLAGITLSFEKESIYLPHIKYVHQLQNLYFALTGEELTFKQQEQ